MGNNGESAPTPPEAATGASRRARLADRWRRLRLPVAVGAIVVLALAAGYFGVVAFLQKGQIETLTETSLNLGEDLANERALSASQEDAIEELGDEIDDLRIEVDDLREQRDYATSVAQLLSDCADNIEDLVALVQYSNVYPLSSELRQYKKTLTSMCTSAQAAHADLLKD